VREYDKNELRSLPYSESDVDALGRLLREAGYRPENVVLMTQTVGAKRPRFAPVAANIRKEIELLLEGRSESDSVVIALAGHGVQFREDEECYFCPSDAKLADRDTLIPLGQIFKSLEGSKANLKLMLVDACRNDPQADNSRSRAEVKLESVTRPQVEEPPGGVAALFSCSTGERAYEHAELKHGVFFHFIIQGLGGEADFDRDKVVTLPELQQYTMKRVPDFVRAEYGVVQTPDLRGKTRGLFPILKLDAPSASQGSKKKLRVTGQSIASRQIVQKYIELLEKQHSSQRKIDDEIAVRWMDNLLESFDASRAYFLQADVDRFRSLARDIDDKARLGDIGFTWDMFQVWVERRTERLKWVDEWLETLHDFSIPEEFVTRGAKAWPQTPDEARDYWRRRVKYTILNFRAKGHEQAEAVHQASRFLHNQTFGRLRSFDDDGLLEYSLTALGNAFDRQTNYISAKGLDTFLTSTRQRFVGIGAQLRMEDNSVVIVKVIAGGPAARDGRLKRGDRIVGVGEQNGPMQSAADMRLQDVVDLIRGRDGTVLRLQVLPVGGRQEPVVYELTRGNVELPTARVATFSEQRRADSRPVKVGFISLNSLYSNYKYGADKGDERVARSSGRDLAKILTSFQQDAVDVAVLDLRFNNGGPMSEVSEVLGLSLDTGPMLIQQSSDGKEETFWTSIDGRVWDRPLMLLTSRRTAPGPEIIAGVLQDYRRAIVVGDSRTSASGSSQSVIDIGEQLVSGSNPPKLGAATISTTVYFLPTGRTIFEHGIVPDIRLASSFEHDPEDSRPYFGKVGTRPPVVFAPEGHVTPKLLENLLRLATERQAVSPEFQEFVEQVRTYEQQQKRARTPLDERQYLAQYQSEIRPSVLDEYDDSATVRDAYLNEVISIALDFAPRGQWLEHYSAALRDLRQKSFADAARKFSTAIEQNADCPEAYFNRARAYAGAGEWDKAVADVKLSGADVLPAFLTADAELKVGETVSAKLSKSHRVVVEKTNGDWLWIRSINDAKSEGWVRKVSLAPIIPETSKKE